MILFKELKKQRTGAFRRHHQSRQGLGPKPSQQCMSEISKTEDISILEFPMRCGFKIPHSHWQTPDPGVTGHRKSQFRDFLRKPAVVNLSYPIQPVTVCDSNQRRIRPKIDSCLSCTYKKSLQLENRPSYQVIFYR